jgi:serine/threonine protein kinase
MDDILLNLQRGLEERQIQCIIKQLFAALHFLHTHRCIHRDLKAGNILLCPDGSIRLGKQWSIASGLLNNALVWS